MALTWGCTDDTGPGPDTRVPDGPVVFDSGVDAVTDDARTSDAPVADGPALDAKEQDVSLPPDTVPLPDQPVSLDTGPATGQIRVATINCYCLKDSPDKRAKGIAAEIVKLDPHAVGLQEVCQGVSSGGSDNFAKTLTAEIKALSGKDWDYKYAKTHVAWSVYDEGVGLLAPKGTILASGEQGLPQGKGAFPRKVIWAQVSLGPGKGAFYLYSTHLTISSDPVDRENQVKSILALVNQHATTAPQVVVGDFNDWYASLAVSAIKAGPPAFSDAWGTKHPGSANPGLTCCAPSFGSRIDYVFIKSASIASLDQVELAFTTPYGGVGLSDHRGLFARFSAQ